MKTKLGLFGATLGALLTIAAPASAHIRLDPAETVVGRQTYWVRVPNEKAASTVNVRLEVPAGVEVSGVLPVAGWQYATKTEAVQADAAAEGHSGEAAATRITEITWSGNEIKKGEYALFGVSTNYGGEPGDIAWKAYQTYADGEVVPWDNSSAERPAPKVTVQKESEIDQLTSKVNELQQTAGQDKASTSDSALWIAILAALMALAALLFTVKRSLRTKAE